MFIEEFDSYFLPIRARVGSSLNWEFSTEIQSLESGDEDRISLRQLPREQINYSYAYKSEDFDKVNSELMNHLRAKWLIPLWYFSRDVLGSNHYPEGKYAWISDYGGGYALDPLSNYGILLFYKDSDNYFFTSDFSIEYHWELNLKVGTTIVFNDNVDVDLDGFKVYPTTIGSINGNVTIETSSKYCTVEVSYNSEILPTIPEVEPSLTFNGFDVYTDCILLDGDTIGISHNQDYIESKNQLGIKVYRTNEDFSYRSQSLRRVFKSRFETYDFLRWCTRRIGQWRPFYMPTYTKDFKVMSYDHISITLRGSDPSIKTFAVLKDGGFKLYNSTSVTTNGNVSRYEIENLDFDDFSILCYALIYRLDTDSIKIDFSDVKGLASAFIPLRSIR